MESLISQALRSLSLAIKLNRSLYLLVFAYIIEILVWLRSYVLVSTCRGYIDVGLKFVTQRKRHIRNHKVYIYLITKTSFLESLVN